MWLRCLHAVMAMTNDLFLDYDLPPHLIAQAPCPDRDQSRLLVVERTGGEIKHSRFDELPELLAPGDLLVLNDTRVLPARLLGRRVHTGGKWEGLFLRQHANGHWELLCQTRGRLGEGETVAIEPGPLQLRMVRRLPQGHWLAEPNDAAPPAEILERHGQVPLPPYIRKGRAEKEDRERYQTVFARQVGAVAAPTAGLHFTAQTFERLAERGIGRAFVTLHVGLGTFQPIQADDPTQHQMHSEWGQLPAATVAAMAACRQRGGRIVAVGTTAVRVLETVTATGPLRPWSGETSLYIYPPYTFRTVDVLVTNFHLPRSTLLLLASAFAGTELLRRAYALAVSEGYRIYSYGDAMLIL
jgi:S-adenosylmethionine:tRNA ribosyltransferase-isomerase